MTELVVTGGVDFVVGPIASPIVSAAIPIIQQKQPIWVVPGSSSTLLEQELGNENYFFHTWAYAYHFHASEAASLKAALGGKGRVAVIYSDDNYGRTHLPYVEKFYPEQGFEIVAKELVRTNSTDLNPILTKISRLKADVLIGLVQTTDAVTLAKQVHTRRLNIPYLVGTSYTQLREWQGAVGEAQEGWVGVTTYIPGMERAASKDYPEIFPKLTEWASRFRRKYNIEPDFLDVLNYATTAILLIAIARAESGEKSKVADALRKLDIETISGRAKFVPSGGGTKQQTFTEMVVFQRQKETNVLVYPADVATGKLQPLKT
jgi:branched-chain amino acid transport system substrate-binding protein